MSMTAKAVSNAAVFTARLGLRQNGNGTVAT